MLPEETKESTIIKTAKQTFTIKSSIFESSTCFDFKKNLMHFGNDLLLLKHYRHASKNHIGFFSFIILPTRTKIAHKEINNVSMQDAYQQFGA